MSEVSSAWHQRDVARRDGPGEEYFTTGEAAAYIKVSPSALVLWRSQGTGPPYIRLARRVNYRRAAIDEWMKGQETATA